MVILAVLGWYTTGWTHLFYSCDNVEFGAKINKKKGNNDWAPLFIAYEKRHKDIVEILVELEQI